MEFYEVFREIIKKKLEERRDINSILNFLSNNEKKIAFYPAGRLSREILDRIKEDNKNIFGRVVGCYDKSDKATTSTGVNVYQIKELEKLGSESLLVLTSNTFFDRDLKELEKNANYKGEIIKISSFETSLPIEKYPHNETLEKIDKVYCKLDDDKSKTTYMIAWLSRLMNDSSLTRVFGGEENFDLIKEPLDYRNMKIKGIDLECKRELFSELYKIKEVFVDLGDVVFDIGAYKGDTAIFFSTEVGEFGRVYAFEPMKGNFCDLVDNIKSNNIRNIFPVNLGASDTNTQVLGIAPESGAPWAYIDESGKGKESINTTTIDNFVFNQSIEKVDFIKIDVEGLEERVINGAYNTIKTKKPKLAIAAYHKTSDLLEIPKMISEFGEDDYKLFFRSKIDGPFGFTFYAKNR